MVSTRGVWVYWRRVGRRKGEGYADTTDKDKAISQARKRSNWNTCTRVRIANSGGDCTSEGGSLVVVNENLIFSGKLKRWEKV